MLTREDLFVLEQTKHGELFQGVNYLWEVLPKIESYLLQKLSRPEEVVIGQGTKVEPGALINGPAIIGQNCEIRQGAYIRGRVIIGDNVVIGNSSELKNCLIFNDVQIPHFSYVGDSILGYKVHLGAGVILSNIKIPPSIIKVVTLEKIYDTGLLKFGALIGDNSEIGCNSVINPGSIIGKNCIIYPLVSWRGVLNPNSIVKLRQEQTIVIKR